jgi:DNA replication protein DnaC
MSNEILNSLLKEYGQKKRRAELDLQQRKDNLYLRIPRLAEIENEINSLAISTAKNILNSNKDSLYNLHSNLELLRLERENILKTNNINLDYLKPNYECKICNDTGYVTDSNYMSTMCSCLRQKLLDYSFNKSNMSNLSKENFDTFNETVFSDEVDIAKYKMNISPRTNIKNIKQKCIDFITNFDNPNSKNLLFTGGTGLR